MRNNQDLNINQYRKEIDGLRAIAVIAVIVNHFDKKFLNSGYLGVDIFFVISGFVITSSIDKNTYKNFIDFLIIFYEKRVKRILPALGIFVLFTSLLICLIIQKPEYYLLIGRRSLLGISNLVLYKTSTDYFANSSALNPFLHTWSLSVEEQFYFIFPFLIWFTGFASKNKNGFRNFYFVLVTLTLISLISFLFFYQKNFSVAYFLMPLRFWEIGIGSLSYLLLKNSHKNKLTYFINKKFFILKNSDFLFLTILLLLFIPNNYGQLSTILMVFSSAILICSISKNSITYKILTNSKLVKLGLLSYSLYLWHWRIIVLSRWTIGIHWWSMPFQITFIYFSALLSYKFVENPIRGINNKKKYTFFTAFIVLIGLFNGLKNFALQGELISKIYKLNPLTNNSINPKKWTGSDVRCLDLPSELIRTDICKKVVINPNINNLIIIGDSHAQQSTFIVNKSLPKGKYNHGYISPKNYGDEDLPGVLYGLGDLDKADLTQYILNNLKPKDIIIIAFHRGRFNNLVDNHVNLKKDKRLTKRGLKSAEIIFKLGKKINSKGGKLILFRDTPLLPENVKDTTICNTWRKLKLNNCQISLKQDLRTRLLQDKVFDLAISLAEANGFKIYSWDPIFYLYEGSEKFRDIDKSGNLLMRDQNHITEYAANKLSIFFKKYLYDQKIIY